MSYLGQVELKSSDIRRVDVTSSTSATHTLTWTPPSEQSLIVTINGVKQQNNYTISGTTLTLDSALVSSDELEVVGILDIGTTNIPADDSITNAMVKSDAAIAQSKLATLAIDTAELADDAVTADKLANAINTSIAANTAKVTNATHTGDVTGATALTIAADAVDIAMLSATGTASSSTFLRGDNAWVAPTGGLFSSYAIICDQKSSGTVSGTFTSGSYQTRDLNTEITDPDGIVSISSNEFTLDAGSYLIEWSAPAQWVTAHKSRLYDVTGTAVVQLGAPEYSHPTYPTSNVSLGSARVSPSGSNAYKIEHRCATTRSTNGFGNAASFGDNEIYTIVRIFKES